MSKKLKNKGRKILKKRTNEPILSDFNNIEKELPSLLHWYNLNKSTKDSKEFLISYLSDRNYSKKDINFIKQVNDSLIPLNLGWLCRISDNVDFFDIESGERGDYFTKHVESAIKRGQKAKSQENPVTYVKKDISTQKILSLFDSIIDNFVFFDRPCSDINDILVSNKVNKDTCDSILDYLKSQHSEYIMALNGVDDYKEAYSNFTKKKLKVIISFYEDLFLNIKSYSDNIGTRNSSGKPRKPRKRDPKVIVKGLKYQKQFDDLGLVSISPLDILGSTELYLYNTKTRTLSRVVSLDNSGFSVKGSAILFYDEKNSMDCKLRKPEEILNGFGNNNKQRSKLLFDGVKTKKSQFSGRVNSNMILLKVFK